MREDTGLKGWCAMLNRRSFGTASVAGLLIVVDGGAAAQPERKPATLTDLLTEMRGLRADLARTSSASMRMQLLTARLSLQEQRIAVLANQRADLLAQLAAVVRERVEIETRMKNFQSAMEGAGPEMRAQVESALKADAARRAERVQAEEQLRAQETDINGMIASEQDRWQDFNARLDDLERSLTPVAPR
jgi:chromosome segregation ATPase